MFLERKIQTCFDNFEVYKDGEMIGLPANKIGGISRQVSGLSSFLPKSTDADDEDGTNMVLSESSSFQPLLCK